MTSGVEENSTGPPPVQLAHTHELNDPVLRLARRLLYTTFADMTDHDWSHALGGVHALVWEGDDLVGHGCVVQRSFLCGETPLRVGYVEAVAVARSRRRRGIGSAIMGELGAVIRRAYDVGVLGTSDDGTHLYSARGWRLWRGQTWAMSPAGVVRTPEEDDGVFVLDDHGALDDSLPLICDWRIGDLW